MCWWRFQHFESFKWPLGERWMALLSSLPEEWGGPALAQVNKTHITNSQAHARGSRFSLEQEFSHVPHSCQSKPRESFLVPGSASRVLCSRSVGFTSPCCLLGFCSSDLLPSGVSPAHSSPERCTNSLIMFPFVSMLLLTPVPKLLLALTCWCLWATAANLALLRGGYYHLICQIISFFFFAY